MESKRGAADSRLILLVDLFSLTISFLLAAFLKKGTLIDKEFLNGLYGNTLFIMYLACFAINEMNENKVNAFKRGFLEEFLGVVKDQLKLCLVVLIYLFIIKQGTSFSRFFFISFLILNLLLNYTLRSYLKLVLLVGFKRSSSSNKVMLITTSDKAGDIIRKIRSEYEWVILTNSVAIIDKDMMGERIEGIEVEANRDNLLERARLNVVDEVFINLPYNYNFDLEEIILEFEKMGIMVHINIDINPNLKFKEKCVNVFAGHQVITFSTGIFDEKARFLKRLIDILGGLIGSVLAIFLTLIMAPIIRLESKGPIFFSQIRMGKNGRKFRIYKFRSMYMDAEERKKELMAQNEMQGFMFKLTDDPRITRVGRFIRKTSLDEFPQFFNVLKGDMSLVGTRPPTLDEFQQYESRHKRRLSLKPGLTGLWQVSGRSDIQDFEEVVRLDLEYIDNWTLKLDVKLILKTVGVVVFGRGGR